MFEMDISNTMGFYSSITGDKDRTLDVAIVDHVPRTGSNQRVHVYSTECMLLV